MSWWGECGGAVAVPIGDSWVRRVESDCGGGHEAALLSTG